MKFARRKMSAFEERLTFFGPTTSQRLEDLQMRCRGTAVAWLLGYKGGCLVRVTQTFHTEQPT